MNTHAFSNAVASNQCPLTPAVRRYFFANVFLVLVMFWHNFGQERGGHHGHDVFCWWMVELTWSRGCCLRINRKKYFKKYFFLNMIWVVVVVPSYNGSDRSEVSLLTKWEKVLRTFRGHSDALHLPKPLQNRILATSNPHAGLSINHVNPVYAITWQLFMS